MRKLRARLQRAIKAPRNAGELPQVTGSVKRLARSHTNPALATFVFSAPASLHSLSPVFFVDTDGDVGEKELLCEAIPQRSDGSFVSGETSSWGYSTNLGNAYAYFPAFSGESQVALKSFQLDDGFDTLKLVVRRWQSTAEHSPVAITACLSSGLVAIGGANVPVYRAAVRAGDGR